MTSRKSGLYVLSRICLFLSLAICAETTLKAQFVAFNDHAPGAGTAANTTTYDVFGNPPGSSGPLKNIDTGANLPVVLTITTSDTGIGQASGQGSPAPGTPLFNAFNGFVDFQGAPNASIELTPGGLVTYTFTGLNPNKRYSFMGSAVRGNEPYTDRWTLFEIAGAASFTAAHTAHVLTTAQVALISPNQGAVNTGVNNTAETGDMVVWRDIDPGAEGSFAVTSQQYVGPVPDGSSAGAKGYGMTGIRLEEFDVVKAPATITTQPQGKTVEELHTVTFEVVAEGNPKPSYQWLKNDAPIPGETNPTLVIAAAALADDGAVFKVIVSNTVDNVVHTKTSDGAVLRVTADTTPPSMVSVEAVGLGQVKVVFSERVDTTSATSVGNYSIQSASDSVGILSASLDGAQSSVLLNVQPLTENILYTLSISGVKDQTATGNMIAANTQKTFSAVTYAPVDIGNVGIAGSITTAPGGYDLKGGGNDIGGTRDQFQFAYQQKTGDFDIRVRLADLTITDSYVKAGLMARETLQDNSRFIAIFGSSAQLGSFFEQRRTPGVAAILTGSTLKFPTTYPSGWLRLRRSADVFTGYGSFDGQAWQPLGTTNLTLPAQLYFGLAVTSGTTNALTTAKFRDIGAVENPASFTYIPKRESIGPSNRRTGLIFSEIMYHSQPRVDGKDLDFVEIYNGEAIFIDLSGWRIDGGIDFTFPNGFRLNAGEFVVVAASPDAMKSVYGLERVLGPYSRSLSNSEETLILRNQAGAVRAEVTYDSRPPWPASTDGAGHSLVCLKPSYGEDDVRAWGPSQLIGGSPGFDDPITSNPWDGLVINEILAVAPSLDPGFIELYNASNRAVDLSGCIISGSIGGNGFSVPEGTRLEPRAWISFPLANIGFAISSAGGTIYLVSADQSRVLDAARFGPQEQNVSMGRYPDGAPGLRRLSDPTSGVSNAAWKQEDIVINEIMYKSVTEDEDDEFIELYNRSSSAVNLSGWQFSDGIDFVFPAGTSIPANGYLVVAANLQSMLANYPQLSVANTVGDFSGNLGGGGERVALAKPGLGATEFVTVAEATYGTGGRWPELANGGGSSLELIDARADSSLASNWAASDETAKSTWNTYEIIAPLNLANQNYPANKLGVMSQGPGDYLLDNIEVLQNNGANLLTNPGFESGQTGWTFYGTHRSSTIRTSGAFAGVNCLLVHATEVGDEGPNSIRGSLTATISNNASVTIRARARWLSGWPEILLRIRGNGVELPIKLQIPKNLGTPGQANSRRIANAGPAISEVTHFPPLPAANQSVVVTARISDPDGVNSPQLVYRVDPGTVLAALPMLDDGTGGDQLAGDGIYSATVPGRVSGTAAFRIQAQDRATAPATTLFPNDAPAREGLIRWADPVPFGSLGHYHLWSTIASSNDINGSPGQDRTYRDCTIVYDVRTIYNAAWRNKGSPFHSGVGSYSTSFANDDLFLGSDKHILRSTGNGGDEATEMANDVAYWIGEKMGLQFNHARYVRVYRNGSLHYRMDYDLEAPDRSIARDWYGGGGLDDTLYKIAGWFEYDDNAQGGTGGLQWANFQKKPANAPPFKTAAYRFNFQSHPGGKTVNDYSLIFNLVAAANAADKISGLMNLADMEQWMRVFAHRRLLGDWDSWSYNTGQNMYMYAPLGERARLMSWDMDFVLGLGNPAASDNLFSAGQDGVIGTLFGVPAYTRMLCRAYLDAANGPLQKAASDAQFDARFSMLTKNSVGSSSPSSLKGFVSTQRAYLLQRINALDVAAFAITTQNFSTPNSTATITGLAPYAVASIEVNGVPYPVTWTGNTAWSIKVPLGAAANVLQIVGKDLRGNPLPNAARSVTVTYTGAVPQATDWVVINEIMYNAPPPDAEYIEIFNSHPTYAFDLSGCRLSGADFTFPTGTFIQPNGYLLVVKDSAAFAAAYGATIPIVGEYAGRLLNEGETLAIVKPGATATLDVTLDKVTYLSVFPWPASANGFGPALQRIDVAQDGSRAGNWGVTSNTDANRATPGRANANRALIDPFPTIWINEVLANNQAGAVDGQGEHEPWLEIYNSGSAPVDLSLYYLSNDPLNPTLWPFPAGTMLGAGQFLVVWADGQPEQSAVNELHASFRLSAEGGVVALSRIQLGAAANIDFIYHSVAGPDQSYGNITDGSAGARRVLFVPTPGGSNNPGNMMVPVTINEWMSSNVRVISDPAGGGFEDWFELFNAGDSSVDLTSYFLSDDTDNSTKFKIPSGYSIAPHGFLLVWADDAPTQNSPNRPDLHVNFKLSKEGDTIALFTPNGALLNSVTFGAQADNISGGRYPDGAASIFVPGSSTPRAANVPPTGAEFTQVTLTGAQLTIAWKTAVGRSYRLEFKSDLNQPAWTPQGEDLTAVNNSLSVTVDFSAAANRFFRVVQLN